MKCFNRLFSAGSFDAFQKIKLLFKDLQTGIEALLQLPVENIAAFIFFSRK